MKKFICTLTLIFVFVMLAACGKTETIPTDYAVQSETVRVSVYAPDDQKQYAQELSRSIGRVYDNLSRELDVKYDNSVHIIVCPTLDKFKSTVGGKYIDGMMSYHTKDTVCITPEKLGMSQTINAAMYEYVQLALENTNKKIPDYLKDGIAYRFSESSMTFLVETTENIINDKALKKPSELEKNYDDTSFRDIADSFIFVDYFLSEYGKEKLTEFIKNPNVEKVTGKIEDEFTQERLAWSKNAYTPDFDNISESEHFVLNYMDSDSNVCAEVTSILEDGFNNITKTLNISPSEKVVVKMYPDFDSFNRAMLTPNSGDGHIGNAFSDFYAIVSPNNHSSMFTRDSMLRSFVHEYIHIALSTINEKIPSYLSEGAAAYFANQASDFGEIGMYIPMMINSQDFPDMSAIKTLAPPSDSMYIIGYTLIDYILREYGSDKLFELLKAPDSYAQVFGKSEDEFYNGFVEWLKKKYCK